MTIELGSDVFDATPATELVPSPRKLVNFHQDYDRKRTSMFLGEPMGILENLHNRYPDIWDLYKRLKNLDWSEDEIDISPCFNEFLTEPEEITNLMIDTLAFQMEADSQAANVAQLLYPFINNTELKAYVTEVAKNEQLHSFSYKFIVENSFEVPTLFLKKVLEIKEAFQRLEVVDRVFQELFVLGNQYNLGLITDEVVLRKAILKAYVTMLGLERIQFVGSFSITFGLADKGISEKSRFMQIAKLVQKIAVDEFQIHVQGNKVVLKNELAVPEIFSLWIQMLPEVTEILMSIINCEVRWLEERLFKDKPVIAGIEKEKVRKFIYYSAQEDVFDFLQIPLPFERVLENPLPFMNKWLEIDKTQGSPQEENTANYMLGGFMDDTDDWVAPTA